jgi:hypothetical protein
MTKSKLIWMIDKDHINQNDPEGMRINWGQRINHARDTDASFDAIIGRRISIDTKCNAIEIPTDKRVRWKAYDDDDILYYEGHIDAQLLLDSDEDYGYNVDRFCMEDAGAVHVYWNLADIAQHNPSFAENHHQSDKKGWIEIYG